MASNNSNKSNFGSNNAFAGFEQFQEAFRSFGQGNNNVDFKKISQLQQKTLDSYKQASKALFDGFQKLAKSQSEFLQEQTQIIANIASKSLNAKTPEENIDTLTRYAQHGFDTGLKNLQDAANSASKTAVNVFDIINKQAVENLSEISKTSKKSN